MLSVPSLGSILLVILVALAGVAAATALVGAVLVRSTDAAAGRSTALRKATAARLASWDARQATPIR